VGSAVSVAQLRDYPNAKKIWLVLKSQHLELLHQVFTDISLLMADLTWGLQLELLLTLFLFQKVYLWSEELTLYGQHAAYFIFMHGVISKCLFIARTVPDTKRCYQYLEVCV